MYETNDAVYDAERPISPKEFETSKTQIYAYQNVI